MRALSYLLVISASAACRTTEPAPDTPGPITTIPGDRAPGTHSPVPSATSVADPVVGGGGPGRDSNAKEPDQNDDFEPASLEVFATLDTPMPGAIAVSKDDRIFVTFPRRGDQVEFTLAEIKAGQATAYSAERFESAASITIDARDRLWVLDAGAFKLLRIDLDRDRLARTISLPKTEGSILTEVRVDLRRGKAGMAYITDAAERGSNAIIVVDLDTGKSRRRLVDHVSTKPELSFDPQLGGATLRIREPGLPARPLMVGVDGLAISGDYLYYSPLSSRTLYRVSLEALSDPRKSDAQVAETITSWEREFASESMEADSVGRIYFTDWEHGAIQRFDPRDESFETVIRDPKISWPSSLALAGDGYAYFISSQFHLSPRFHQGKDSRDKPYFIHRIRTDSKPAAFDEARAS